VKVPIVKNIASKAVSLELMAESGGKTRLLIKLAYLHLPRAQGESVFDELRTNLAEELNINSDKITLENMANSSFVEITVRGDPQEMIGILPRFQNPFLEYHERLAVQPNRV
jgi:hypothetical protein